MINIIRESVNLKFKSAIIMKCKYGYTWFFALIMFGMIAHTSYAQIGKIPDAVTQAFEEKYPDASEATFVNKLVETDVSFQIKNVHYKARFSNKGEWQATLQESSFAELPEAVQDGFHKSKYADWDIESVYILYQPDKPIEYRIGVSKNAIQKKNLYFNSKGRLLHDNITL
ncbi:Putative beta-lactamase-inhibitor-like, PepSY-like [Thermoflavifilum thermophilum]|uniref:Putative beta-lactamase-inhibitor-like, PepSY-like n=2 Tax=Thermoflavifilum thermophilum TaxID=1393122 RepID=A0A1I7NH20_9BACT|nr:Putative beta-lactamase-inhibitor-like, PepSY-like [Thermoflavifilum thermophilum]